MNEVEKKETKYFYITYIRHDNNVISHEIFDGEDKEEVIEHSFWTRDYSIISIIELNREVHIDGY